ncbi:LuxR C-terminal-related transcriptional regulator [Ferrimonas sp.]|uniref:LuxR C-terminal-related transcriptional regulator n=1 Tax=Ferrimonas sp. TaxID=2080861 RepID=UPI003A941968
MIAAAKQLQEPGCDHQGLQQMLAALNEQLGLAGIWYCYDIAHPGKWRKRVKSSDQMIRSFVRRRRLFASSGTAAELWQQQMTHYQGLSHVLEGIWNQQVYFWPMRELPHAMNRRLTKAGVEALVTFTVDCPLSPEFRGRFTLLLPDSQSVAQIIATAEVVQRQLRELQVKIALEFGKSINPLVDYNIVNPLSAYILGLLAQGQDREQVSAQLRLTLRGVDYHVSVLKELLEARNIAQLVYRAGQCQLI